MYLFIPEIVISLVNVILAGYVILLTKKEMKPKLYVDSKKRALNDDEVIYSVEISPFAFIDFNQRGFPEINHNPLVWELYIGNNSEVPATNVVLKYSIIIKKHEFDVNDGIIKNEHLVDFKEIKNAFSIDYIAPGSRKKINIVKIRGDFPEADLKAISLKSSEDKYLKKEVILDSYLHPEFNVLQDSHHSQQMLGVHKSDKLE